MADLVRQYLQEVEATLHPSLDGSDLAAVLLETEQHLRERVAALVELGQSLESAQRDALADFGPAQGYAGQMAMAYETTPAAYDRPVLATSVALGVFSTVGVLTAPTWVPTWAPERGVFWLLGTMGALTVGIGAASYRSCRAIPYRLGLVAAGTGVFYWISMSCWYLNLYATGGAGYQSRWELAESMARWSQPASAIALQETYAQNLAATRAALEAGIPFQLWSNLTDLFTAMGIMAAATWTANLVGAWLGQASRRRRNRRLTHA